MMDNYDNKMKLAMKHGHVLIELITIPLNNGESNDQRQVTVNDVDVQTEKIMSQDAEVYRDSLHNFESPYLNINVEETPAQNGVTGAVKDSGNTQDISVIKNCRVVEAIIEEPRLTTTNITSNIRPDLGPIIGYAAGPLLPLSKAYSPLTNILHNLSFYVQLALEETPEQPPNGLTIDESAAIRLYKIEWDGSHRSLYSMLNRTLKKDDHEHLRPYFKYLKLFLTALAKLPCVPSLTVWRGVTTTLLGIR
jgi:hypothetical protein